MQTTPISDEVLSEIDRGEPISEVMPLRCSVGVLEKMEMTCVCCDQPIADSDTRVRLVSHAGTHTVRGWGVCRPCRTATPILMRLHDDGRVTGPAPKTANQWAQWDFLNKPPRLAWWNLYGRARRLLRRLSQQSSANR